MQASDFGGSTQYEGVRNSDEHGFLRGLRLQPREGKPEILVTSRHLVTSEHRKKLTSRPCKVRLLHGGRVWSFKLSTLLYCSPTRMDTPGKTISWTNRGLSTSIGSWRQGVWTSSKNNKHSFPTSAPHPHLRQWLGEGLLSLCLPCFYCMLRRR